jgi:ABC-2 type transport system permease protein
MPREGFSWAAVSAGASRWMAKLSSAARQRATAGEGGAWLSGAQREGSPWHGLGIVFLKELSDNLTSVRMLVLELLMVLFGAVVVYLAAEQLRQGTAEDPFLFLRLFAPPGESLLTFVTVLSILVPLMAIGLGFDAINGEHNRRTLSRILAQPIYRDALLLGKFLAALATLTISLIILWLMVVGFGLIRLGIPPNGEELGRSLVFLLLTVCYAGVWLAVAMLFSVLFRSTATAALVSLGLWLFFALLWPALARPIAEVVSPSDIRYTMLGLPTPDTLLWQVTLARLSPGTLYSDAITAMLNPDVRSLGPLFLDQLQGMVRGAPLPFGQSIILAWPQTVALIAITILLYVVGYIVFQRQEVRA